MKSDAPRYEGNFKVPLISIVDDDAGIRGALKTLIVSIGCDAATFTTAEEFLLTDWVRETACLIADIHLPGLSGLELQARLIADGYSMPIIFITAIVDERTRAHALKCGAFGFLAKPCEAEVLIDCVQKALAVAERADR